MLAVNGSSALNGTHSANRNSTAPVSWLQAVSSPVPYDVIVRPNPLLMAAEQVDGEYVLPRVIT